MKTVSRVCGLVLWLVATSSLAELPTERIVWDKRPITLTLSVNDERMVHFPQTVEMGLPPQLAPILRVQIVDETVYLLATDDFEPVRVPVRQANGQIFLFDLAANKSGGIAPVQIVVPKPKAPKTAAQTTDTQAPKQHGYVSLTRYAAQQLYAPARLVRNDPAIARVPIRTASAVNLVRGAGIHAQPLITWQSDSLFVTAVKLTNRLPHPVELDPRHLRGHWLAATFQHGRLFAAGDREDTTTVYLVSPRPFAESFNAGLPGQVPQGGYHDHR